MNERTRFFIKIYLSLFIFEMFDVGCVWETSWRRGQTATYWPQVILTIAALLALSDWAAQPWVTDGPNPSAVGSQFGILSPTESNWNRNSKRLKPPVAPGYIFVFTSTCFQWAYASATIIEFNHDHRSKWYSDIFDRMYLFRCSSAFLHRCISWLTAQSRVNMLQYITVIF